VPAELPLGTCVAQPIGDRHRKMMREECKHFQSRTYDSGEASRFCVLDLAPEAPWRCPDNCPSFAPRLADVAWVHGSLIPKALGPEPNNIDSEDVQAVLQDAEKVVEEEAQEVAQEKPRGIMSKWRGRKS
jgi:hypothetical protein